MPSKIAGLGRRGRQGNGPSQKVHSILPMRLRFLDRGDLCPASGMTRGRHDATPLSPPASTSGTHEHFDPPVLLPACLAGLGAFRPRLAEGTRANPRRRDACAHQRGLHRVQATLAELPVIGAIAPRVRVAIEPDLDIGVVPHVLHSLSTLGVSVERTLLLSKSNRMSLTDVHACGAPAGPGAPATPGGPPGPHGPAAPAGH